MSKDETIECGSLVSSTMFDKCNRAIRLGSQIFKKSQLEKDIDALVESHEKASFPKYTLCHTGWDVQKVNKPAK